MNVRHAIGAIFYQKHFYDKMDLRLFYFHVTKYTILANINVNIDMRLNSEDMCLSTYFCDHTNNI